MVPVVYLPEAEDDVAEAHAYYEEQQIGLGNRFVQAVHDHIDGICSNPRLYGVVRRDVRATPLHDFPFIIY